MPEGLDATSFDFYEGIRILVPGATALALGEGLARTYSNDGAGLELGTIVSFFVALLIGLVFYFVDAPAKAAIFSPLQPTDVLMNWSVRPKRNTKTINLYFVMLDTVIPASIRARALYMGSMYRIGFEFIYLLAIPSISVVCGALLTDDTVHLNLSGFGRDQIVITLFVISIWLVALRRDTRPGAMGPMSELDVESKKFSAFDLAAAAVAAAAFALLAYYPDRFPGWVFITPTASVAALWARRYFRGYAREWDWGGRIQALLYLAVHPLKINSARITLKRAVRARHCKSAYEPRRPIAACQAVFLLGVANLLAIASVTLRPPSAAGVSDTELRLWYVAMGAAIALVCARGHEKRLRGAYMTQNTWLTLNKKKIIAQFFIQK